MREDIHAARVLTSTELRAVFRRMTGTRRKTLGIGLSLLYWAVAIPWFLFGPVTSFGAQLASGPLPLGTLGKFCASAGIAGLYFGAFSALNQNRIGSVGPLVRTAVSPRAVTSGRLASELAQMSFMFLPLLFVVLIEVGIGARNPLVAVLLGVVVLLLLLAGFFLGRSLGAAVRYVGDRSRFSTWVKIGLFVSWLLLVGVGMFSIWKLFFPSDVPFGPQVSIPPLLPGRPLQAYAGTIFAPAGGAPSTTGVLAVAAVLAVIPAGIAAAVRIETAILLRDDDSETTEATSRTVPDVLGGSRSTRVAWRHLLRSVRDPKSLSHVAGVLFAVIPGVIFLVTDPSAVMTFGPPAMVGLGATVAGLSYCLNPLGDDRDQLPFVLTSVGSPVPLLRGRLIAASLLGFVFVLAGLAMVPFGSEPVASAVTIAASLVIVPAGAGIALGLGAFSPSFERQEYMNVERATPSQNAMLGYMFLGYILLFGGSGGCWGIVRAAVDGRLPPVVAVLSVVITLGFLAGLGLLGYKYAVRRFDGFTLEAVQ